MYKIGLKLWSTNTDHYLHEAIRLYAEGVYDYIELFVVPETKETLSVWFKIHEEHSIPFIIHNAHSAVGFNLADASCEARNREIYVQTKLFADKLDAKYIIFHGGVDGTIEEVSRQLKSFEEPRALIENKPYLPLPGPMMRKVCRGATIEEISDVIDKVGCGFCLDIGHAVCAANSQGVDPYSYIERFAQLNPAIFHLSDITDMASQYDAHPHLGSGELHIKWLKTKVFPANAIVSVETVKEHAADLRDFEADVNYLRKI